MTVRRLSIPGRLVFHAVLALFLVAPVACDRSSPAGPTPVQCTYTLSSQGQSFSSDGGAGSASIATDQQCSWSVEGASDWLALTSPAAGTGPAAVHFTVSPNSSQSPREMTLTIAHQPFTISQDGRAPCTFSIAPDQQHFDDEGGSGQVEVTAVAGCAWTATSTVPWITVTSGAQGKGAGTLKYAVTPNNDSTERSGTLTIAKHTFTVRQDGEGVPATCTYAVSPVEFSPCMPGGQVTSTLTTGPTCQWTVSPGVSWLSVAGGSSRTGPGTITITFPDNYDAPRDGIVKVRWPTPTAGQNLAVAQAGCLYGVSQADFSFASAGGPGTFNVVQQSDPIVCGGALQDRCVWTAQSDVAWITVTSSMPRSGDNPVAFTVAANSGTTSRSGRIAVRDKVVTITQAAP